MVMIVDMIVTMIVVVGMVMSVSDLIAIGINMGEVASIGNEAGLRSALRNAFEGEDELILKDPIGARVQLTQGIVDHMMSDASRQDGRERYFPLLRELVEDPAEIWIGWARSDKSGRVALRRRYVKLIEIGAGRIIGLIADADGSVWSGFTLFRSRKSGGAKLRSGLRIFKR